MFHVHLSPSLYISPCTHYVSPFHFLSDSPVTLNPYLLFQVKRTQFPPHILLHHIQTLVCDLIYLYLITSELILLVSHLSL